MKKLHRLGYRGNTDFEVSHILCAYHIMFRETQITGLFSPTHSIENSQKVHSYDQEEYRQMAYYLESNRDFSEALAISTLLHK